MTEKELLFQLSKNPNGILTTEKSEVITDLIKRELIDKTLTIKKGEYIYKLTTKGYLYLKELINGNQKLIDNKFKTFLITQLNLLTDNKTDFTEIIDNIQLQYQN